MQVAKRVVVMLNSIGAKTYNLPADLREVLRSHFEPTKIVIAERFYFHRRNQAEDKNIANYVAELQKLSTHCKFGDYM